MYQISVLTSLVLKALSVKGQKKNKVRRTEYGSCGGVYFIKQSGLEWLYCEFKIWAQTWNAMNVKSIPSKWNS